MYQRHVFISDWLIALGIDKDTAISNACKIEHAWSEKSFAAMKNHIEHLKDEGL